MTGNNNTLHIFLGDDLVAQLILRHNKIHWQYTERWRKNGFAISPHLPLEGHISETNVQCFLRNFLPEGSALDEILLLFQLSHTNTFGLIRAMGTDLPGALVIVASHFPITKENSFRAISDDELIQRLDMRSEMGLVIWDQKPRLSVAGIQDKINIVLNDNGQIGFPEGDLCSTHILKFERKKQAHLVINEYLSMNLAKYCGLDVANVFLKKFGTHRALLVTRFDRKKISDLIIKRRHVIDGCQVLNLPPTYKYERNFGSNRDVANIREGASLTKLFQFSSQCRNPAETKLKLLDWTLFNCLIFNCDAHAKNITFYVSSQGISLTPFYDLVNVAMYPNYEQNMAMALGDEFDAHALHAYQFADFAESCCISRKLLANRLKALSNRVLTYNFNDMKYYADDEQTYIQSYKQLLHKRCYHLLQQSDLINDITV